MGNPFFRCVVGLLYVGIVAADGIARTALQAKVEDLAQCQPQGRAQ